MGDNRKWLAEVSDEMGYRPGRNWCHVDPYRTRPLHRLAGVYAIYINGTLVYVGQSVDIPGRLRSHGIKWKRRHGKIMLHTRWTGWVSGARIGVKVRASAAYGDWLMREARLIRRLRPAFNRTG